VSQDDQDRGLDAAAGMLRVWAKHPFSLPSREAIAITQELEAWASHLLLGHPRPGASAPATRSGLAHRDWLGVRQYVTALRQEEAAFVAQLVSDFQQTVHGLVTRVRAAIAEERVLDDRLGQHLEILRRAAASNDLQQLRTAAVQAADAVSDVIQAHQTRHAAQEAELSSRIEAMGQRLQTAEKQAEEDALTGLINRRGFDAELEKAASLAAQFSMPSSLLIIDLDHFKRVNDTFGHPAGDATLRATADVLTRSFPRRGDCVARYGGEEFGVILRESRVADAERLAERFVAALRPYTIRHNGKEIRITASVGVGEWKAGESAASWLARVDKAVYAAKSGGRDRVVVG
jgi:diguanylate cyclase (GGDEF)-like protein